MKNGMLYRDPSTHGERGFKINPEKNAHDKANLTAKQPGDYPGYELSKEVMKYYFDPIVY